MRGRLQRALPSLILLLAMVASPACGKRADPLAPYLKTPQPPTALAVSQVGDSVEIRVTAPLTTTENRPLPVIELEWLQAPASGAFEKVAISLFREDVAPGEIRTKSFPIPPADVRFSVRAYSGKARSNLGPPLPFKPAPVPAVPTEVDAFNLPTGVQLTWTNPPGAEPWPTPTPIPTPSPTPEGVDVVSQASTTQATDSTTGGTASPTPGASGAAPAPTSVAASTPTPVAAPTPTPLARASPEALPPPDRGIAGEATPPSGLPGAKPADSTASPTPSPSPTPTPTLLSGIRILRTDGTPRLAHEPLQAASWLDPAPKTGETPCYALRYASSITPLVESLSTEPVCVEVKDLVAPEPSDRLLGDIGDTFVELSWLPSPSADVDHYRVYRTMVGEARAMVIQTDGLLLRVRDLRMTPGRRTYEVTAVDPSGNESLAGPPLQIDIP